MTRAVGKVAHSHLVLFSQPALDALIHPLLAAQQLHMLIRTDRLLLAHYLCSTISLFFPLLELPVRHYVYRQHVWS